MPDRREKSTHILSEKQVVTAATTKKHNFHKTQQNVDIHASIIKSSTKLQFNALYQFAKG